MKEKCSKWTGLSLKSQSCEACPLKFHHWTVSNFSFIPLALTLSGGGLSLFLELEKCFLMAVFVFLPPPATYSSCSFMWCFFKWLICRRLSGTMALHAPLLLCEVSSVTLQRTCWKVGGPGAAQGQPAACLEWTSWMEPCVGSGNKKSPDFGNRKQLGWYWSCVWLANKRWANQRINEDDGAISATVTWCCRVTLEPLWWLMAPVEPCCWRQEWF